MAKTTYRTSRADLEGTPPGIPCIIGNEAAESFSFYGMKAVLAIFMVNYLHLMDGAAFGGMSNAEAQPPFSLPDASPGGGILTGGEKANS